MSFFQSNNKITKEFSFEITNASPSSLSINKTSGTGVWNLNGEKIVASNIPITIYTGMTGGGPTYSIKLYSDSLDKIDVIALSDVSGAINISEFHKLSSFDVGGCTNLTAITNPISSEPLDLYHANYCNIIGTLDLSGLSGLGGSIRLNNNSNLTNIINPTSDTVFTRYEIYSCGITGTLDLSGLNKLGGSINLNDNPSLTGIINPTSNTVVSAYSATLCNLIGNIDISNMTGMGGLFDVSGNPNLTGVTNPISSQVFTVYGVSQCNITGNLDISGLSKLGGNFGAYENPNLTGITHPVSSQVIGAYLVYSCGLQGTLNLSTLTGLGGRCYAYSNPDLTSVVFPVSTQKFTRIYIYNCPNLGYMDFWPLSGGTNDEIEIRVEGNSWNATEVNHTLVDLDNIGWTGVANTLIIGGVSNPNAAPDSSSGGYNGTTAKANLITKGWTVFSN